MKSIEADAKQRVEWINKRVGLDEQQKEYAEFQIKEAIINSEREFKSIFLIEKGWIDPMENRNADGYKPYGYKLTEDEAKEFCESKGFWTVNDCWSIGFYDKAQIPKFRYKEIPII